LIGEKFARVKKFSPAYNLALSSLFDIHFNILYSSKSTCPRGLFQDLCILHNLPISSHMITVKHFMKLASRSNTNDQAIQRSNTLSTTQSLRLSTSKAT